MRRLPLLLLLVPWAACDRVYDDAPEASEVDGSWAGADTIHVSGQSYPVSLAFQVATEGDSLRGTGTVVLNGTPHAAPLAGTYVRPDLTLNFRGADIGSFSFRGRYDGSHIEGRLFGWVGSPAEMRMERR